MFAKPTDQGERSKPVATLLACGNCRESGTGMPIQTVSMPGRPGKVNFPQIGRQLTGRYRSGFSLLRSKPTIMRTSSGKSTCSFQPSL